MIIKRVVSLRNEKNYKKFVSTWDMIQIKVHMDEKQDDGEHGRV
jgi:hypothetical protein